MKYVDVRIVFQEVPDEITLAINVSGCTCHCEGCHSPYLAEDIGEHLDNESLNRLIEENKGITCICFMGEGGDPGELNPLISHIKDNYNLKIGYYTGREELPTTIDLNLLDFYKVGPYIKALGPLTSYRTNQRFYRKEGSQWINRTDLFWGE